MILIHNNNVINNLLWQDPPRDPIDLPLLIQDHNHSTAGQLKFIVDLLGAAPHPQECEPISNFIDIPSVAFLFKFVDMNSGNISYKWTVSET